MTLAAIDDALGGDADSTLRAVVATLASQDGIAWAAIAFVESGQMVLGPSAGTQDATKRQTATVRYKQDVVGELWVDGEVDGALLDQVADRIAAHVLLGWDTGGEDWDP